MLCEPTPVRSTLGDDDPLRHAFGHPPKRRDDLCGQPAAPISHREQIIHINKLRLELDQQDGSGSGVPCHEVDDASLAVMVERDLGSRLPAGGEQQIGDHLGHGRMPGREGSVKRRSAPARLQDEADFVHSGNFPELADRGALDPAPFDLRIGRRRNAGLGGGVPLRPAKPDPKGSKDATDREIVHADRDVCSRRLPDDHPAEVRPTKRP